MRLTSTNAKKMLFAAIPSICALSSKKISIYNEEMIVARCFIGFIILSRKSLGKTFKVSLDGLGVRRGALSDHERRRVEVNHLIMLGFLLRWGSQICRGLFLIAAVFHGLDVPYLYMDPPMPNPDIVDDMGTVEDVADEQEGPNLHRLQYELRNHSEASQECSRLAVDSLERAENLCGAVEYRRSVPDPTPDWNNITEELIDEANDEVDYPAGDLEMAAELDREGRTLAERYREEIDAEYARLRDREKSLKAINDQLKSQIKINKTTSEGYKRRKF